MSAPKNIPLEQVIVNALLKSRFGPKLEAWANETIEVILRFIQDNPNLLEGILQFLHDFKNLPTRQREVWSEAASLGWYMNSESSISMKHYVGQGQNALDSYMMQEIEMDWPILTRSIVEAYPSRANILNCAFELHSEGRYIASIPLFFAQADGICAQNLGAQLFTDKNIRKSKITERLSKVEPFTDVLFEILGMETQFNAGMRKAKPSDKLKAANRNGILHGSRKHLDYGTKVNSLKAFSLLAFVVLLFSKKSPANQNS